MSKEYFIKGRDGSNFITIEAGEQVYELLNMTGETQKHFIDIRFLDALGDDVIPTGNIEFQHSHFRKPLYRSIENGSIDASELSSDSLLLPVICAPCRAIKLTLTDIVGAVSCIVKITGF